jgi:transposase-like protein
MEAYVNGVSTRKVDHLVSELGIHMSKDQVSRICSARDGQVEGFRTRPLEAPTPTSGSTPST